jgi:hypothetical protein
LVLALVGAVLASGLSVQARRLLAAGLAVWTLLPGTWSPDYWLGLAFHAPSVSAMLLCVVGLRGCLGQPEAGLRDAMHGLDRTWSAGWILLLAGLLLGYALLLDTFAVLPLQLYAWGFSPALLLVLLVLALLPWVLFRAQRSSHVSRWLVPVALLLFATTRLPTGNVWDAVLDPWLFLALHGVVVGRLLRR